MMTMFTIPRFPKGFFDIFILRFFIKTNSTIIINAIFFLSIKYEKIVWKKDIKKKSLYESIVNVVITTMVKWLFFLGLY